LNAGEYSRSEGQRLRHESPTRSLASRMRKSRFFDFK
jgi:hypothetical protein